MMTSENFNIPNSLIIQMRTVGHHQVEAVNTERKELNMAVIIEYVKDSVISKRYVCACVRSIIITHSQVSSFW